jgi:8-oxo-dGTP pyrophosphatase MutT (NUDIX family)
VVPTSLGPLAGQLHSPATAGRFAARRFSQVEVSAHRAAVLVALTDAPDPAVIVTRRAGTLAHHAGQVSFPGGALEPGETPVAAALREACEEVALDPAAVHVLGEFPPARIDVSRFAVRIVVGWWDGRAELKPNPAEVASVAQLPLSALADPAARFTWTHPRGLTGPGFTAHDLYIWGFTAFVLDAVLAAGGWEQDWDKTVQRPVPAEYR